jgi:hypothetical protein
MKVRHQGNWHELEAQRVTIDYTDGQKGVQVSVMDEHAYIATDIGRDDARAIVRFLQAFIDGEHAD